MFGHKMLRKGSGRYSRRQTSQKKGRGLINTLINKLPIELHLPGYNYCGPGTKLKLRLQRGDRGINFLDEACKEHDIAYSTSNDLKNRQKADQRLYQRAVERFKSRDASVGEKIAATAVAGIMKGKTKLGMGIRGTRKSRRGRKKRRHSRRVFGGAITFLKAMKKARDAIKGGWRGRSLLENSRMAYKSLKKPRRWKILPPRSRVIPIPKTGGFLPLIPLFAALGALGSLGGGAAAIAKAVNEAKSAKDQLKEATRHNLTMESKAVGRGFYVKPYKSGCGLFLPTATKN